jgi:PGF-CTERM protein
MRGATVLVLSVLVVLGTIPTAAATTTQDEVTMTVTVVDGNGQVLDGITINASWEGGYTVEETRANGQALVDVPAGADVSITVERGRYVRNDPVVVEDASGQSVEVSVRLQGTATVTVQDTNGEALDNAIVRLWQGGEVVVNTRTDANGVVQSPAIEQGEYRLVAFKQGYLRNSSTLDVTGDVSRTVAVESDSITVTFGVEDDHFDPPRSVEQAQIEIGEIATIRTLSNGEATASVPVNARLDVTVTKENYTEVTQQLRTNEDDTSLNVTIRRTPAISIDSVANRVVMGESTSITITNEYGEPVPGASVSLDGESVGETDDSGEITFQIETEGAHTVSAQADDLEAAATIQGVRAATDRPTTTETPTSTATATATEAPITTSGTGPGFGPVAALLALVATLLVVRRRHE